LLAIALLLATAAASCSPADVWPGTIEERGGVVYVQNPADGMWQEREPAPLRFALEQVYGAESEPADAIIGAIRSIAIDDSGNVYVLDRQPLQVVSFAPDGSVRWRAGREGGGPGELDGTRGILVNGDELYLLNRGGAAVDTWDTADGTFRSTLSLVGLELGFGAPAGFLPPDTMVLGRTLMGGTGVTVSLVALSDPPEVRAQFTHDALPDSPLPEHFGMEVDVMVRGDRVVLGSTGTYHFRVLDAAGQPQRVVSRDVDYLVGAGVYSTDTGSMIAGFGGLYAPVQLSDGYWLARVVWPTNVDDPDVATGMMMNDEFVPEFNTSYDLFDAEGRFLYSLVSEGTREGEYGSRLVLGPDGALYTQATEPFPQVRRYRVVIEE
jgi:hypothetical protein